MKLKLLFVLMTAAAFIAPVSAQENETPNGRITSPAQSGEIKALDKRVTIRMKGVKLTQLLEYLSQATGLSFSIGEDLADLQITVFIRNCLAGEILEMLTKSKDLEFRRLGNTDNLQVSRSTVPFAGFPPLTRKDIEDPLLQNVVDKVSLKEAPLTTFLDIVSAKAKVNFVVAGGAQDIPITTVLTKTTVADILLFLKGKGLSYSRVGNSNTFVIRSAGTSSDDFAKAEKAYKDRKYEEAIALYRKVAETFPDSEMADSALLMTAVNYDWIAARDNDLSAVREEEKFLNRLISGYPKSSRLGDAYLYLGQLYSGNGGVKTPVDCAKAVKYYELAIGNTYRDWIKAQADVRIAQCYERDGKKEKAEEIYKEIVEKYPETPIAKELRGRVAERDPLLVTGAVLEEQGKYKLAIDVYEAQWDGATAESRRKAELRVAICQAALRETDDAIKTFEAYITKYQPKPEDDAYSDFARALEKAGRGDEARKYRGLKK